MYNDCVPIFHIASSPKVGPMRGIDMNVVGSQVSSFHDSGTRRLFVRAISNGRPEAVSHSRQITGKRGWHIDPIILAQVRRQGRRRGSGHGVIESQVFLDQKSRHGQATASAFAFYPVTMFSVRLARVTVVRIVFIVGQFLLSSIVVFVVVVATFGRTADFWCLVFIRCGRWRFTSISSPSGVPGTGTIAASSTTCVCTCTRRGCFAGGLSTAASSKGSHGGCCAVLCSTCISISIR
jgi:hypothetical protein